jgi:PST family polysaccharide transporter
MAAIAVSFPFSGIAVQQQALLRRQMKFMHLAAIQIGSSLLSLTLAINLALHGFGYWALVVREVARSVLMAGSWLFMPWLPDLPSRQAGVGSMLRFGGDVTASNLAWLVCSGMDQVLRGPYGET